MKTHTAQLMLSTILREIANERWPMDETEPEDSTQAWAGECGLFVDAAWGPLERAGISFSDEGMISKFSDLTCVVNPPPGLSLAEVRDFGIERHINHHWLTSDGRHFDASCPDGVDSLFDLRGIRQTAVEVLRRDQPMVLERLCNEHHWWRESMELFDEFLQVRSAIESNSISSTVITGCHIGPIVSLEDGRASQKIGRDTGKVVWHDVTKLLGPKPVVGNVVEINYSNGMGFVKDRARNSQSLDR